LQTSKSVTFSYTDAATVYKGMRCHTLEKQISTKTFNVLFSFSFLHFKNQFHFCVYLDFVLKTFMGTAISAKIPFLSCKGLSQLKIISTFEKHLLLLCMDTLFWWTQEYLSSSVSFHADACIRGERL